ncbi:LOW QUALITY PROTEIN: dynein light chain Tctex-type 4 [Struthio camelus]|uniref:LOW QUALITY PROTEIN: dynein light chain Tctex-type 4 n=1 Tax=Struthio camelus TaxID=8801 RepID=UPI003603F1A4
MAKQESALLPLAVAPDSAEAPPNRGPPGGTHCGSQPPDAPPRPIALAKSTKEGKPPLPPSRRSSILSTLNAPFASRRSSLGAVPGGKRPSVGPWMLHQRVSFSGLPLFQPIQETRYENTYKMQPDEGCKFNASRVQQVLESALASSLGDAAYSAQSGAPLAHSLADLLRSRAKEVVPPRYKLVCHVLLGQRGQQSLLVASRTLWDPQTDSFASATFSNASLFAVATVHGLYFE